MPLKNNIQHRSFDEKRVRKNFADASVFYDYWAFFTESRASSKVLEWAEIQGGEAILEVGTGTGLLFEKIVKANTQGFTAGIDLSPDMLDKAQKRLSSLHSKHNFSLSQASAYELPFEEQTFDGIVSCYVLDLLPEKDFINIFAEFKRVLKPDGRLVLASMSFGRSWYHHFWTWMADSFPDLMTDCRPVKLTPFMSKAGFKVKNTVEISQNTFPSEVICAVKS